MSFAEKMSKTLKEDGKIMCFSFEWEKKWVGNNQSENN